MITRAKNHEAKVLEWIKTRGGDVNYTKLYRERRFYYSALGEYAFEQLLIELQKDYRYTEVVGRADSGDFILHWQDHNQRKADVKTATQSFHRNIMLPKEQGNRHQYHFYVGVKLNGDEAEIWGYCALSDFLLKQDGFDDQHVPTLYRPLTDLADIDVLLGQIVGV